MNFTLQYLNCISFEIIGHIHHMLKHSSRYPLINLVVRRLNLYVGKERILCFPVAPRLPGFVNAVATVVKGNQARIQQSVPCHQANHT